MCQQRACNACNACIACNACNEDDLAGESQHDLGANNATVTVISIALNEYLLNTKQTHERINIIF